MLRVLTYFSLGREESSDKRRRAPDKVMVAHPDYLSPYSFDSLRQEQT